MSTHDIDKSYVSPADEFLFTFDATHPKSLSQQKEVKKYQRIFKLRDEVQPEKEPIWEKF